MALQRRFVEVAMADGTVLRAKITPRVEMYFERTYHVGMNRAFQGDADATNLYRLAWEAVRMTPGVGPDPMPALERWLEDVEAITVEAEDIVRPTSAAVPDGESPTSPSPPA